MKIVFPIILILVLCVVSFQENENLKAQPNSDLFEVVKFDSSANLEVTKSSVVDNSETITVNFKEEQVRTILRSIADIFDLNLVIPNELEGIATVQLKNVTWRQAFEVVLDPLGYTYVEDRNLIRIKRIAALISEPTDTRVFLVNYSLAAELKDSLIELVDTDCGGRIHVDLRSNALVVTERPSKMNKIQEIIERLDKPTPQLLIEAKLFEMSDFQKLDSQAIHSPEVFEDILKVIESDAEVNLVSSANVVVLDGEAASIDLAESMEFQTVSLDKDKEPNLSIDFEMGMSVTPEVNSVGFIRLDISFEINRRISESVIEGESKRNVFPDSEKRGISTKVMVKDGYTLAIGGIKSRALSIPVSEITPQGFADENASTVQAAKQCLLFVTTRTLNPDGVIYKDTVDPRVLHDMHILDRDIPGYSISNQEMDAINEIFRLRNEAAQDQAELSYRSEFKDLRRDSKRDNAKAITSEAE